MHTAQQRYKFPTIKEISLAPSGQAFTDWKTGCYNTDCPGFIPFRVDFGLPLPGMVFEGVSSYNQTDSSLSLQIVKDERPVIGGDWWLYYAEGPMTARLPLGFWPQRLFDGDSLGQYATEAAWYGAVGFGARGDEPAMGSGHGPGEGPMRAAYFASISLMGRDAFPVEAKLDGLRPMVNGGCYQVAMDAGGNNTFFYGGPVAPSCNFR
nr:unnamed protein product [Digitaria exilis]